MFNKRLPLLIPMIMPVCAVLSLFITHPAKAENVTVVEFCNVNVTFKASVPNSVKKGNNFTITNISVQPAKTYGFTVSSSQFEMTATNTSSSTYNQNFVSTDPSPTTGESTYVGYYPNWSMNATGNAGSEITIRLVRTVTIVQGFGTVHCPFSKTLATIPITGGSSSPSPSPSPSSSPSNSPKPSSPSSPSSPTNKPNNPTSPSPTKSSSPSTNNDDNDSNKDDSGSLGADPDEAEEDFGSLSVVPLIVEVKDNNGNVIHNAKVTLNGSETMTTDENGRAIFSNVLTGAHSILVSYKGTKLNKDIVLTTNKVGKVYSVELTPPQNQTLILLGIAGGLLLAGSAGGFFIYRRIRDASNHTGNISGVISDSVGTAPTGTISHVPAISVFPDRPQSSSPAPWAPANEAFNDLPDMTGQPVSAEAVEQASKPINTATSRKVIQPLSEQLVQSVPTVSEPPQSIQQAATAPTQPSAPVTTTTQPIPVTVPEPAPSPSAQASMTTPQPAPQTTSAPAPASLPSSSEPRLQIPER